MFLPCPFLDFVPMVSICLLSSLFCASSILSTLKKIANKNRIYYLIYKALGFIQPPHLVLLVMLMWHDEICKALFTLHYSIYSSFWPFICYFCCCFKFYFFIFERDWNSVSGGGQRERERENPKQAPHCQHRAWCRAGTHETMRPWPELKPTWA